MGPRSSIVWKFFRLEQGGGRAVCLKCETSITYKNQSTTGLIRHVRAKHGEVGDFFEKIGPSIPKRPRLSSTDSIHGNPGTQDYKVTNDDDPIDDDLLSIPEDNDSLGVIVSKLAAVDGIAISLIATSSFIRQSCEDRGVELPTCPKAIIKIINEQFEISREIVKREIAQKLSMNNRFSISFDSYLTPNGKAYFSVNLHGVGEYWNLGMVIFHSLPQDCSAIKFLESVSQKLEEYGLSLQEHIVACVTSMSAMHTKFAALCGIEHQLCHAEGLQHTVARALYDIVANGIKETPDESKDEVSDEENYSTNFLLEGFETSKGKIKFHGDLIHKVRTIVKVYTKTPDYDGEISLDNKTKWTSLLEMLEKFLLRKDGILEVIRDRVDFDISPNDILILKSIVHALKPIKLAIERLGNRDSNLLTAEAVIKFIYIQLRSQNTEFANTILKQNQTFERRSKNLSDLLKYLNNPQKYNQQKTVPKKDQLLAMAKSLLSRLFQIPPQDVADDDSPETPKTVVNTESLSQILDLIIERETDETPCLISEISCNDLGKEFNFFEATNLRTDNIRYLHHALRSIPPCTIDVNRAFSAELFRRKLDANVPTSCVNALCFLRHFYLKRGQQ